MLCSLLLSAACYDLKVSSPTLGRVNDTCVLVGCQGDGYPHHNTTCSPAAELGILYAILRLMRHLTCIDYTYKLGICNLDGEFVGYVRDGAVGIDCVFYYSLI